MYNFDRNELWLPGAQICQAYKCKKKIVVFTLVIAIFFIAACTRTYLLIHKNNIAAWPPTITGTIIEQKELRYNIQVIIHTVIRPSPTAPSTPIKLMAYLPKRKELHIGDHIILVKTPTPLSMNNAYHRQLIRSGIYYQANIKNYKIRHTNRFLLKSSIQKKIIKRTKKIFSKDTASFMLALYLGNKNYINKKILYSYKRAGVLHVLAASGLHVGIIVGIISILAGIFCRNKKLLAMITSLILFIYLYITIQPVSLLRACIMYWLYTVQVFFDIKPDTRNTLFLSTVLILLLYPYQLYALGFHLSFGATLGIVCCYQKYTYLLPHIPFKITESLALTLAAQIFVIPIIALQLNEINYNCIITNILTVMIITIPLLLSLCTHILYELSRGCALLFSTFTNTLVTMSRSCITYAAGLPGYFMITNQTETYFLITSCIVYIIPLIFKIHEKYRKVIAIMLISCSILLTITPLYLHKTQYPYHLILFKKNKDLFLYNEDTTYIIYGSFAAEKEYSMMRQQLALSKVTRLSLYITSGRSIALHYYCKLVKEYPLTECIVMPTVKITFKLSKLLRMLENDHIPLHINHIDKRCDVGYNDKVIKIIKWHHQYKKKNTLEKKLPVYKNIGNIHITYI